MTKPDSPTTAAAPYGEAERQSAELAALRLMLDASHGCFSLSVAVCNSPALRDYVIGKTCQSFPGIQVISIPANTVDVFQFVSDGVEQSAPAALLLLDLEASIPSDRDTQPTLRSLNASRELWQRKFSLPVVFWLPDYAAALMSIHARDFWRYRSHRFEFVAEQAGPFAEVAEEVSGSLGAAAALSAEEKRFRIAELEQRIAELGDQPQEGLARHAAVWLNELGFLHAFIGDLDAAERMHRKSLQIEEKLGRLEGMASDYGNLGLIYGTRGDLDGAEEMLRKSLQIHEKLGRLEGMARDYGNLGLVYDSRGDLDGAEEMLRKALQINEKLGRLEGMSINYGNLGLVYRTRGDLDGAEEMLRKALQIEEKLGRLEGMASEYGNLGLVYRTRGDLDGAEEMHGKALQINEKLGRLEGIANQYANLGSVAEQRGDTAEARELWTKARELFERIGMPHRVEQVQGWLDEVPDETKG